MLKIAKIIKKDLKLLVRSKTSSLVVIFGPLLVMLLVGTAFDNSNQYTVNIGVYSSSYSDMTDSFINTLIGQKYNVRKSDSNQSCVDNVKQGIIHTCVIFPPDLSVENDKVNEIVFHVDYSRINLVWMIVDSLSSGISSQSKSISVDLTKTLLEKLQNTKEQIVSDIGVVNELKNQNLNLNAKNELLQQELISLKAKITDVDSSADTVKAGTDKAKEEAFGFKTDTLARIGEIKSNLELVRDKLLAGNQSVENLTDDNKKFMVKKVDNAIGNAQNIEYRLGLGINISESSLEEANHQIGILKDNLGEIRSKVDTLDAGSKSIEETLAASVLKVESLEQSFNSIHAAIGGLQVTNAENIASPISTKIQPLLSDQTHLNYLFSGLLTLVIMFIALLLSTTLVMMEKTSPSYFRNFITPTGDFVFVISSFFTTLIIVLLQMAVIVGVAAYFFNTVPLSNLLNIYVVVVLITCVFTSLGMFVGYTLNSQETATLASISLGSLGLLLSNMILPLESMPEYVRSIAQLNPFVIGETLLKNTILFQSGLAPIKDGIILLSVYTIVLFGTIMFSRKLVRKHFLHKIMYKSRFSLPAAITVVRLVKRSEKALNKGDRESAFKLYTDACGVYELLRKNKHPKSEELYSKLKELHKNF